MSNARNLARLIVDSGGDLNASNLGNAPNPINAGTIAYLGMSTAPTGWLKANGAAISRTTYADLFAAIGTTYGTGDGSTTFNIPDLRGEFVRGFDDGRGADSGRGFGSAQSDAMQGHGHAMATGSSRAASTVIDYNGNGTYGVGLHSTAAGPGGLGGFNSAYSGQLYTRYPVTEGSYGTPRATTENRPRNIALLACIKY